LFEIRFPRPPSAHQIGQSLEVILPHDRHQAIFEQVAFVPCQHEAGARFQDLRGKGEVVRIHRSKSSNTNLLRTISPSKGFIMYSSPVSSALRMKAGSFSVAQNTTITLSPPG